MFKVIEIGDRKIVIGGVGKLFYQDGFPISICVTKLKAEGYEVSILHVADECMKNGWSAKTTYNKIKVDFEDDIEGAMLKVEDKPSSYDWELLYQFCHSEYERQRDMIFEYLFKGDMNTAISVLMNHTQTI